MGKDFSLVLGQHAVILQLWPNWNFSYSNSLVIMMQDHLILTSTKANTILTCFWKATLFVDERDDVEGFGREQVQHILVVCELNVFPLDIL